MDIYHVEVRVEGDVVAKQDLRLLEIQRINESINLSIKSFGQASEKITVIANKLENSFKNLGDLIAKQEKEPKASRHDYWNTFNRKKY